MADRTFRRPVSRVRVPKRTTSWVGSADQPYQAVGAGGVNLFQSNATLQDTTIVRTRGVVSVKPNAFTADVDIIGALGMGLVSDQAFAAGATSIPAPYTDTEWGGWFVWIPFALLWNRFTPPAPTAWYGWSAEPTQDVVLFGTLTRETGRRKLRSAITHFHRLILRTHRSLEPLDRHPSPPAK